jgi:8-oxo-dGTP pyrophosphatase MutT (NUDIX family)
MIMEKAVTRFERGDIRFGARVAGVVLHNQHILLQGEPQGAFWTLPGGGIDLLESSQQALKREMREELGVEIQIKRLLWFVEHFFASVEDGKIHHEFGLFFLITFLDASHVYQLETIIPSVEAGRTIIFQWFKLDDLAHVRLYPSFLSKALLTLPLAPEHLVESGWDEQLVRL